jgi:hypothetical protein
VNSTVTLVPVLPICVTNFMLSPLG